MLYVSYLFLVVVAPIAATFLLSSRHVIEAQSGNKVLRNQIIRSLSARTSYSEYITLSSVPNGQRYPLAGLWTLFEEFEVTEAYSLRLALLMAEIYGVTTCTLGQVPRVFTRC